MPDATAAHVCPDDISNPCMVWMGMHPDDADRRFSQWWPPFEARLRSQWRHHPPWFDLESAMADVAVIAWTRRFSFTGTHPWDAWVMGIARMMVKQYSKPQRHITPIDDVDASFLAVHPVASSRHRDPKTTMIHLRSIISDRDMEIFFRIANGDSYRDIARDIGISTDALAMRIHRLRRHISDQIRDAV